MAEGARRWSSLVVATRIDDRDLLPRIEAQTLILSSTASREVPSGVGLYLRDRIPRAHLAELPGADHFVFATRSALVNLLVEQILPTDPSTAAP
jgi:non-heme chloroperoxidase